MTSMLVGSLSSDTTLVLRKENEILSHDMVVHPNEQTSQQENVYSIFTLSERRILVFATSIVSFIGPLTGNIYTPVLNSIAQELQISTAEVNLSITVYLISQGVAPIFIAPISDVIGRRVICILGLIIFTTSSLGLALNSHYAALLGLRCIQSLGASALASISGAVVADCVVPADRGSFMGFTMIGPILGPSLSPILGGLLSQYGDWRVVFWVLTGFGSVLSVLVIPFLPETCRAVVGNGSHAPSSYQDSWANRRVRHRGNVQARLPRSKSFTLSTLLGMWVVFSDIKSLLILILSGFVSAGFWCITTSIPSQYSKIYHFSDSSVGLSYLPMAAGGLVVTFVIGKWDPIDGNYRRHARRMGIDLQKDHLCEISNFPFHKARLQVAAPLLLACSLFVVGYGWALETRVFPAGPLVLLFFICFCMMGMGKAIQMLLMDMHPSRPATVVAAFNVAKSLLGASMTAASAPMIEATGNGWTYTTIGGSWLFVFPVIWLTQRLWTP
ncbi:major facilitator superfamily domain-containing protein [Truncatella angustata]|uniref:Major facilitator superfamily domain-containing protein n=1 Tax=Truncatella angustata TaxID=152316 RepID=A0A9P8UUS5_9PEZI|nr:major facilitator superfamily domain-containing protein [Truncatella angustata]KAH6658584.1 major facilitator superfamily domain-containing protein [Truncatella angustata]